MKYKNPIYKDTCNHKSNIFFQFHVRYIQDVIKTKTDQGKRKYYEIMSRKIFDKSLNPKKMLVSSKNIIEWEKVPCIPPIYHSNKFTSEIKAKCEYFNLYFAGQCMPHVNNSQLPTKFATIVIPS